MSIQRTRKFLDDFGARYVIISHAPAYTAQEVAASAHIPGRDMIKVVAVVLDGRLALAAVAATCDVDLPRLRQVAGAQTAEIAREWDFAGKFPGCQVGAMPPIGQPFGVQVYVDRELAKEKFIAFNAGTHRDVIAMQFSDFRRVAHPKLAHISVVHEDCGLLTAEI
jgi:Ala-tRNA(Pro) deacylase